MSIRFRRNTKAAADTSNPVLAAGEPGFATDTGDLRIGDGTSTWSALPDTHRALTVAAGNSTFGRKRAADVREYGAVGDGVTDDTTAFQDAINSGVGVVHVPAGVFKVGPLTLPSNTALLGVNGGAQAPGKTRLVYAGPAGGTMLSPATRTGNTINWTIAGLIIDGAGLAAIDVEFYRVSYSRMADCLIGGLQAGGVGVVIDGNVAGNAYFNIFDNVKLDACPTGARFTQGANANRWQGGAAVACGTSMEFLSLSSANVVVGTDMENASVKHVYADAASNVFIGLHMENAPIGFDLTANANGTRRHGTTYASTVTTYTQNASTLGHAIEDTSIDTTLLQAGAFYQTARYLSGSTLMQFDPKLASGTATLNWQWCRNVNTSGSKVVNIYRGDGTASLAAQFDLGNVLLTIGDGVSGGLRGGLAMANVIAAPSANPTGGLVAYSQLGALRVRTANGSTRTIGDVASLSATAVIGLGQTVVLATGGAAGITLQLPSHVQGGEYLVKKVDSGAGAVTVTPGSGTIDGAANKVLAAQYGYVRVVSDGTNWHVVGAA